MASRLGEAKILGIDQRSNEFPSNSIGSYGLHALLRDSGWSFNTLNQLGASSSVLALSSSQGSRGLYLRLGSRFGADRRTPRGLLNEATCVAIQFQAS